MGKTIKRNMKKAPREPRSIETLDALLHCKGGPMRDRCERRPSEETRISIQESLDEYEYEDT